MFLRHEGFLGALGAFMSYEKHGLDDLSAHHLVERFPMGAPYVGGKIHGPPLGDLNEKVMTSISYYRCLYDYVILVILQSITICIVIDFLRGRTLLIFALTIEYNRVHDYPC